MSWIEEPYETSEGPKLTSYWYNQHPTAYLMHLKDVFTRMDQEDPAHSDLKSNIRTYIQQAEELETMLLSFSLSKEKRQGISKEERESLSKKLEDLNKENDQLTNQVITSKIEEFSIAQEIAELENSLIKYVESIYNPLIGRLNNLVKPYFGNEKPFLPTIDVADSPIVIYDFLANNKKMIEDCIDIQSGISGERNKIKQDIALAIENVLQKEQNSLFRARNKRYQANNKILAKIENGQKETELLNSKIKELSEVQSRKLVNIAQYAEGTTANSKVSFHQDNSTQDSIDEAAPEPPSQLHYTSTQIVFHQEKKQSYIRVALGVWAAILAVSLILGFI